MKRLSTSPSFHEVRYFMKSITLSEGLNQEEIARKKQELEKLEQQLAENELDLSTARRELHLFENRYQRAVGSRYAELDRLKASVLEMATRIHPESKDFRSQAEAAREQANQSAHNWEVRQEESDLELPEPSEELKKMFRDAAKRIHPDLTTDPEERERRHALMARLRLGSAHSRQEVVASAQTNRAGAPSVQPDSSGIGTVEALRNVPSQGFC
jgi:chromosome segregation ATPase